MKKMNSSLLTTTVGGKIGQKEEVKVLNDGNL